jgi:hypothetical protein
VGVRRLLPDGHGRNRGEAQGPVVMRFRDGAHFPSFPVVPESVFQPCSTLRPSTAPTRPARASHRGSHARSVCGFNLLVACEVLHPGDLSAGSVGQSRDCGVPEIVEAGKPGVGRQSCVLGGTGSGELVSDPARPPRRRVQRTLWISRASRGSIRTA